MIRCHNIFLSDATSLQLSPLATTSLPCWCWRDPLSQHLSRDDDDDDDDDVDDDVLDAFEFFLEVDGNKNHPQCKIVKPPSLQQ